ncbi:MAG TPA: HNH endonuclease [Bacillota bacterium]|nr:HNH endonuclease [Bacillota bacterium]
MKKCRYCNKEIKCKEKEEIKRVTCGDEECRRKHNKFLIYRWKTRRNIPMMREEQRKCKVCGKIFVWKSSKPNQIYCSKDCCNKITREEHLRKISNCEYSYLKLRFEIFKRDNFICQYCGRNPKEDKCKLVIEHKIPRNKGGKDTFENLLTSCEECNYGKSDTLLEKHEFQKRIQKLSKKKEER